MLASSLGLASFSLLFEALFYEDLADLVLYKTQATLRALVDGHVPYWDAHLALGVPVTFSQDLAFHPLSLLFLMLSPGLVLAIFIFAHVLLAQYFMLRLCRLLGFTSRATTLAVVTMTFSGPALAYTVLARWPTLLVQWALIPPLFYFLVASFHAPSSAARVRYLAALALCVAFVTYNSHPGLSMGVFFALVVFGLVEAFSRRQPTRIFLGLVAAAFIAALISGDKVVALLNELALQPADLPRSGKAYAGFLYEGIVWELVFRPFFLGDLGAIREAFDLGGVGGVLGRFASQYVGRNTDWDQWGLFFGPPFALLALYVCARRRSWMPHGRSLAATFFTCLIIMPVPPRFLGPLGAIISGTVAFRDPLVFLGIVIAAGALSHLQRSGGAPWRLPREIAVAQICLVLVAALPSFVVVMTKSDYTARTGRPTSSLADFFLDPATREALAHMAGTPGRVYTFEAGYAPQPKLLDGGYSVLNGWIKGVTLENLAPSPLKIHAYLPEDRRVLASQPLLDVLGVRNVLVGTGVERPAFLRFAGQLQIRGTDIDVLRNDGAWPAAVFVSEEVRSTTLPLRPDCTNESFLCRDFLGVAALRRPGAVDLEERQGDFILRTAAASNSRTVMVSQMFRPGWRATAGGQDLETFPALGALIGVRVPPDVTEVRLEFRPPARVTVRWLGLASLLAALAALAFPRRVVAVFARVEQRLASVSVLRRVLPRQS